MSTYALSVRMRPEEIRELSFVSIGVSYTRVGDPFEHPISILQIQNLTNAQLFFSFSGTEDHIVLPAGGGVVYDCTANRSRDAGMFFAEGDAIYVARDGTPSSGSVFVTAFYPSVQGK